MKKLLLIVQIFLLINMNAYATQEMALIISQPLAAENGIVESKSTYVYYTSNIVLVSMSLTCAENSINTEGKYSNRNLANIYGFKTEFSLQREGGYIDFGDTIVVDLVIPDRTSDSLNRPYPSRDIEEVLKATIICLFNNATSFDFVHYLDLKVFGRREFEKYSKVYSKDNIFKFDD